MSPKRTVAMVLLLAIAGCAGVAPANDNPTSETTSQSTTATSATGTTSATAPHTAIGTSHNDHHLTVRAAISVNNVTVTLAPSGETATHELSGGSEIDLTREIHSRGHGVEFVVERGDQTVYSDIVHDYQGFRVTVEENDTRLTQSVV